MQPLKQLQNENNKNILVPLSEENVDESPLCPYGKHFIEQELRFGKIRVILNIFTEGTLVTIQHYDTDKILHSRFYAN